MTTNILPTARRATAAALLGAAMLSLAGTPAHARFFVGFGVPFYGPGFYPPPVYYPPPAYYPPPPTYYTPPPPAVYAPPQAYSQAPAYHQSFGEAQAGGGQACYAGSYVCPMDRPVATGGSCYCPGNGGQRIWGKAN